LPDEIIIKAVPAALARGLGDVLFLSIPPVEDVPGYQF
jgi:hypothetical protein